MSIERLTELKEEFPELTFDNDGYEYLSKEVSDKHQEQIKEISSILKTLIPGFIRFDNFKPRSDDTFAIRVQYNWGHAEGERSFTGVGYFKLSELTR